MKVILTFVILLSLGYMHEAFAQSRCLDSYADIFPVSCGPYTSPSGVEVWTELGVYMDTIANVDGCDSIITIYLTVINLNLEIIQQGNAIVVQHEGGFYQWLNCDSAFQFIPFQTNQGYTPDLPGNYAAVVEEEGCIDTTACFPYMISSTNIPLKESSPVMYPNPVKDKVNIDLRSHYSEVLITIFDQEGRQVYHNTFYQADHISFDLHVISGVYFTSIIADRKESFLKLTVE